MHALSHRSEIFAVSCRVNIYEAAVYLTVSLLSAVFPVGLPGMQIFTGMSDSKSLNISLPGVLISSKNEHVFIRDLGNLSVQIIFDAWWASIHIDSKPRIAWNDSRHTPF